jgi:Glycine zipper
MRHPNRKRIPRTSRFVRALVVLALIGMPVACGGDEAEDDQAAVDRQLDVALAGDSGAAELQDVEATSERQRADDPETEHAPHDPAPDTTTPDPGAAADEQPPAETAPAPDPGPRYEELTAPAGARVTVTLDQTLSTEHAVVGDLFTGTVQTPLTDDRTVIVPVGSRIRGTVTAVQKSGGAGQDAVLKVHFEEIVVDGETYPIRATLLKANATLEGTRTTGERVGAGAVGAGAGAIIGAIIGDGTGALIGAAAGAAAGTAISMGTEDKNAVLAEGSEIVIQLDVPLVVRREI